MTSRCLGLQHGDAGAEAHTHSRLIDFVPFSTSDGLSKCHQRSSALQRRAQRARSPRSGQGEAGIGPGVELRELYTADDYKQM